jgi:hypothetical protein
MQILLSTTQEVRLGPAVFLSWVRHEIGRKRLVMRANKAVCQSWPGEWRKQRSAPYLPCQIRRAAVTPVRPAAEPGTELI